MAQKVRLLYKHPIKAVRALAPKPLRWTPRGGVEEYCSPQIVPKGKDAEPDVFYDVSEAFARRLLGNQSERYFLISPPRLSVQVRDANGFSFTEKLFEAVKVTVDGRTNEQLQGKPEEPKTPGAGEENKDAPPIL